MANPDCEPAFIQQKIGTKTIQQILEESDLGYFVNGVPLYGHRHDIFKDKVIRYASQACQEALFPPIIVITYETVGEIIDGHHRLVVSRLMNLALPIKIFPAEQTPPPKTLIDWSAVEWI